MEYRKLPHGGEQISIIGMGASVIGERPEKDIIETVQFALDEGINYFDLAAGHAAVFRHMAKLWKGAEKEPCCRCILGRIIQQAHMAGQRTWIK